MHPHVFLETFWRLELRPQVFVAMSFDPKYKIRFDEVIDPAIRAVPGITLEPFRVDISKSGDSILTDIINGIAHSQLVLADVSTIGHDSESNTPYRNANVMYEVGLALACRQSSEVLLVRDDEDKFLFDVSTVPHKKIDFADIPKARVELVEELTARLGEQKYVNDARVPGAIAGLTSREIHQLKQFDPFGRDIADDLNLSSFPRLLDKQLVRVKGQDMQSGLPVYALTPLGSVVAGIINSGGLLNYFARSIP